MLSVVMAFLAIGAIIIIGFVSNLLFNKSKIPDVLILILLGYLIGPGAFGIIDHDMFTIIEQMAPFLAALALAMIMFDGGLGLNYDQVLGSLTRTMLHTIVAFVLSVIITTAIAFMMMGWDFITSLLLGAILGGTSGAVVIPLVNRLRVSPRTRTLLTIESALTDVIVIVMAMSIILLMQTHTGDLGPTIQGLAAAFFVSFMIGLIFGIFWLRILAKLNGQPFSYMVTIAVLLIMYALTDILVGQSGVGAIAALVFGLVLGNKEEFARIFKKFKGEYHFNEEIRQFHCEISFFVRTFFFVYLGIVFSVTLVDTAFVVLALGIFLGLVGVRFLAANITSSVFKLTRPNKMAVFFMMPRGLSAAVLASYPLALGVVSTEVGAAFLSVTLVVIVLTTIMSSIGSFTIENAAPTPEQQRRMNLISRSRYAARWLEQRDRNGIESNNPSDSDFIDLEE
jgi:cell volume regulation protein A